VGIPCPIVLLVNFLKCAQRQAISLRELRQGLDVVYRLQGSKVEVQRISLTLLGCSERRLPASGETWLSRAIIVSAEGLDPPLSVHS
jgi:hypothetical protein